MRLHSQKLENCLSEKIILKVHIIFREGQSVPTFSGTIFGVIEIGTFC